MDDEGKAATPASRKRRLRLFVVASAAITTLICAILAAAIIKTHSPYGLPAAIVQQAGFPLYFPSSLPNSYTYKDGSARQSGGIVFYALQNGQKQISISEQAAPANPPDFSAIQKSNTSFRALNIVGGQAIYGVYQGTPAAILLTNTTLININGAKNMPLDVVAKVAQDMSSVPSQ